MKKRKTKWIKIKAAVSKPRRKRREREAAKSKDSTDETALYLQQPKTRNHLMG